VVSSPAEALVRGLDVSRLVLFARFFMVISDLDPWAAEVVLKHHYIKACRTRGVAIGGSGAMRKARIITQN
jgi:hypothetical protein